MEAKDTYLRGHSVRVSRYAVETGRLLGMGPVGAGADSNRWGAARHRKIGTRESLLQKPGSLTEDERHHISEHPVLGERMLGTTGPRVAGRAPDRAIPSRNASTGADFPTGLRGNDIPIEARIVAVADSFDAMTSERPYRDPRQPDDAIDELGE
jgi:HD-GYP domain-containing protein (c-di-GMP phosphodiesterase class II)